MGAWGVDLYSNDTASDVRGDYIDLLKKGMDNEEITQYLINQYKDIFWDDEEASEFWFALADTQWKYGRLLPMVKDNAFKYLESTNHLERWKEEGESKFNSRVKVLDDLKVELLSPMPPVKKVSQYRLYQCEWNMGDVFAYKFNSEYSKQHDFYNKYMLFQKIDETTWWPGHVVPVVRFYKWVGDEVPNINVIDKLKLLPQFLKPTAYDHLLNDDILYRLVMLNTSKRVIPKDYLTFLGNKEIKVIDKESTREFQREWKNFEEYEIKNYFNWSNIEI